MPRGVQRGAPVPEREVPRCTPSRREEAPLGVNHPKAPPRHEKALPPVKEALLRNDGAPPRRPEVPSSQSEVPRSRSTDRSPRRRAATDTAAAAATTATAQAATDAAAAAATTATAVSATDATAAAAATTAASARTAAIAAAAAVVDMELVATIVRNVSVAAAAARAEGAATITTHHLCSDDHLNSGPTADAVVFAMEKARIQARLWQQEDAERVNPGVGWCGVVAGARCRSVGAGLLATASGETGQRVGHSPLSFFFWLVACCFGGEEATEWCDGDSDRV